jgi:predicted CoA-binding protein
MDEAEIPNLLRRARTIAVIGMKDESTPHEPAFGVPRKLQSLGYHVMPVNPRIGSALGIASVPDLASLPEVPDIVNVFRRPEALPAIADEILALPADRRPAAVWFQTGIAHAPTAERLRAAGILVVEDACLGVHASRLGGPTRHS